MEDGGAVGIEVIWRGERMKVGVAPESDVRELGSKLVELTKVKPDTMKLLVPLPTGKGSRLLAPFSSQQPSLSLREAGLLEGKPIRMMGVSEGEIAEVSRSDLRIIGFDEEEERLRQRSLNRPQVTLKLPQGKYIFCEFRTLELPGIKLNPPASDALKRMHMLACDPGIVAIMNKHRWRVGIMTEMAPEGYVGISPKCILGFNKNHGEEISLRLRTDDLKGFRKYESIKKTLLHELAHMVFSEHDANFYALDKQLNQEASSLDWTKSRGHILAGQKFSRLHEDEDVIESSDYPTGRRLGGAVQMPASARVASAIAAYNRQQNSFSNRVEGYEDSTGAKTEDTVTGSQDISMLAYEQRDSATEQDPDDSMLEVENEGGDAEPDPDDALSVWKDDVLMDHPVTSSKTKIVVAHDADIGTFEPDPDDSLDGLSKTLEEPDPDDSAAANEPDPDDLGSSRTGICQVDIVEPDANDSGMVTDGWQAKHHTGQSQEEPDPDESNNGNVSSRRETATNASHPSAAARLEPDPDDSLNLPENQELNKIEEPVTIICNRLQTAIKTLRSEAAPGEVAPILQTLFKIIRNVVDHPNDVKFRRLRKGNPLFQKNVANYKAAMEVLAVVGFCEDVVTDELGRSEAYMVLKRDDPGLLWLAKSSLEVSIA